MATQYTTLLGFALPVTGELSGSWGTTVNDSITQLEEDAIAGVATASVAGGNWTLSTTGTGATNEARKAILIPTGSPGVSRNIVAPSQSKAYIVDNKSNAAVVLKGTATSGVTIAAGENALCAWSGTDFVKIGNFGGDGSFTNVSISGTTTLAAGTANGVAYLNGSKVVTSGTTLTFNGTTLGAGAATFSGAFSLTGDEVQVAEGGTGATTAATALVNLGERTSATGSVKVTAGTTAQRDGSPAAGYFRFNNTNTEFEGYNGSTWGAVGGGASGGSGNPFVYENDTNVTANYTINTGKNAMSAGPITIDSGFTVTVPSGSVYTIV